MPTRWQFLLRPTERTRTAPVPPAQLHGLACRLLEGAGAEHHGQIKPFAVLPLMEAPHVPGHALLGLGWLDDFAVPPLEKLVGEHIRLGSQFFTVADIRRDAAPYSALLSLPPTRRATLTFRSVTYFTRGDRWIPLPDPELLYGNLIRRWDTFAPEPLPESLVTSLLGEVRLTRHTLRSAPVNLGPATRTGFTGEATFTLPPTAGHDLASTFTALSAFAEAAGTGAQTTHGLGWTTTSLEPMPERNGDDGAGGERTGRNRGARDTRCEAGFRADHRTGPDP
ncbi:CRISPR system precrRNA processing endoribonuclease RAMP protein Cas6 [Streptomyces albogriseolus]|uniref:CRISPR system precrRNA processing endoribonuclease RAMP protein Cas6 n=1 Tax=Streptomyces albogriseolus TaxID=1887 RepID=UPI00345F7E6F